MKLQKPRFSLPAAEGAAVPCWLLQLLPALGQFPGPGSCWPQSPSQWELEEPSRGVQRGQCWLWSRVPAGVCNKKENSPSLIVLLPPTSTTQPISSKRICGVCADHRAFLFFFLTLLLHSIWCLFSCAASCLLHLNPGRESLALGVLTSGCCVLQPGEELKTSGFALVPWLGCVLLLRLRPLHRGIPTPMGYPSMVEGWISDGREKDLGSLSSADSQE